MTNEELDNIRDYAIKIYGKADPQHGFSHVERVSENASKIVSHLKIKKIDSNLLKAACYLHDIPETLMPGGPFIKHYLEILAVKIYMPDILKKYVHDGKERKILFRAIVRHTFSIPYRILNKKGGKYTKVLQDADSIDYYNPIREKSLMANRNRYIFYFIISLPAKKYLEYGRKHMDKYLNYPELANYQWF